MRYTLIRLIAVRIEMGVETFIARTVSVHDLRLTTFFAILTLIRGSFASTYGARLGANLIPCPPHAERRSFASTDGTQE